MDGYFVFDDINSADYKIWIKAGGTYGAAARRFTTEVVPGRNGSLTIDDGAYEEKEHPYECHIGDDFPENIEAFRNAIMSKVGRFVLSDSFHPGEYYNARYMRGLEPDVAALAKAGAFTLTFSRDPRRFLVDGDTPQDVAVNTETLSGTSVSFDNATGADRITGLSVSVMAAQSGSGDPSPTNIRPITGWTGATVTRTGKNLLDLSAYTIGRSENGITYTVNDDMTISASGTATGTSSLYFTIPIAVAKKWAGKNFNGAPSVNGCYLRVEKKLTPYTRYAVDSGSGAVISNDILNETGDVLVLCRIDTGITVNGAVFKPMIRDASFADSAYEPYKGTTYPVTWSEAGTVYGGTLDVTTGVLTVTHRGIDVTSESNIIYEPNTRGGRFSVSIDSPLVKNYTTPLICNMFKYGVAPIGSTIVDNTICSGPAKLYWLAHSYTSVNDFKAVLSNTPMRVVAELEQPISIQIDPVSVESLLGNNNICADCGDVSVTLQLPSTLINPTRFTAQPLIRVYGQGRVDIGSRSFTVSGSYPYVDIDAEMGDCYYNGANANSVVSFSGGYPELLPGENYITFSGVTKVEITPRWWRL